MNDSPGSAKRSNSEPEILHSAKKQKLRYNRATVSLSRRLATAVGEHVTTNLNEQHREQILKTLNADNGTEAGEKCEDLLVKFKGKSKQKAIKEKSEKINENSP